MQQKEPAVNACSYSPTTNTLIARLKDTKWIYVLYTIGCSHGTLRPMKWKNKKA